MPFCKNIRIISLAVVCLASGARAATPPQDTTAFSKAAALQDSIRHLQHEQEQLQSVIERGTFGLSSYFYSHLRSWIIPSSNAFNDSLAQYFFEVTQHDSTFIQQRGDIQVVATTGDTVDLVGLVFSGNEQEKKGKHLFDLLNAKPARGMYERVLMSGAYGEERQLVDDRFKAVNRLQPRLVKNSDTILTSFTRIDIDKTAEEPSLLVRLRLPDRARIGIGKLWGVEWNLGNEEVGYPFWLSGNMRLLATYQQIAFGVHLPFAGGRAVHESYGTLLPPRMLDGTYGFDAAFDAGFAGGSFMIGLHRNDVNGSFADPDNIYTLRNSAQLWYSYAVAIGSESPASLLRFKIGLGFHQVGFDRLLGDRTVYEGGVPVHHDAEIVPTATLRSFWSPYVSTEFMNQQFARRFGADLQYYDEWGVMSVWLEIVPDVMRLELKGAAPLLRKRQPWEPGYFTMITMPITFSVP